ncbi:MAG: pantoate--beta-alanine ligase [Woeseia sp.]
MQVDKTADTLRERLAAWRRKGDHIALVPTMGNLHDGHLSLIELARNHAERVVVSVFVNPTQFGPGADFEAYPRTLGLDKRRLKRANADLLFTPDVGTMYPFGIENATTVSVPGLRDELCGPFRPGHFDGVTSVVSRLFGLVSPDVAVFGQKDYQQQLIIRRMVEDLHWPIEIITGPTVREADGLAFSSRNQYLSEEERRSAPAIYEVLQQIARELQSGKRNHAELERHGTATLSSRGLKPDYLAVRRAENLEPPDRDTDKLVVLTAAWLGKARLIDNVLVDV